MIKEEIIKIQNIDQRPLYVNQVITAMKINRQANDDHVIQISMIRMVKKECVAIHIEDSIDLIDIEQLADH